MFNKKDRPFRIKSIAEQIRNSFSNLVKWIANGQKTNTVCKG